MMQMMAKRGLSAVGIVVVIVVLAVVVAAGLFFFSDVWRTKMKGAYTQFADWTPENIAKDPGNYLNFCEEQTKKALEKLKASEIAIAQKKSKLDSMREDAQNKVSQGDKALDELKVIYRKADADKKWPATWRTSTLDQDQCKRQVVRLDRDIRSKGDLLKKLEGAVAQLNAQTNKVQEARDKANEQLAKISTNREVLKVQQITDDLKNSLVAMKGIIETSVVGAAGAGTGTLSLDDLAAQSEAAVNEGEFSKIMGQ